MKSGSSLWEIFRSIAPRLDGLATSYHAILVQGAGLERMLQQLMQGQAQIMATLADIKTAEQAQGAKIDALIALTDTIYQKLQASPVSEDPAVQEVLDMISARDASIDAAIARDTPADTGTTPPPSNPDAQPSG